MIDVMPGGDYFAYVRLDVQVYSEDGGVHIILGDGANFSCLFGINVGEDKSLTIYGQSDGAGSLKIDQDSFVEDGYAGIGGGYLGGAEVTITGGQVIARGNSGDGIGGGNNDADSFIILTYTDSVSIDSDSYCGLVRFNKPFTDGIDVYNGTYDDSEAFSGKTLVPYISDPPGDPAPVKEESTIQLQPKSAVYTGKTINIDSAVVTGSTGKVTYTYYSDPACRKKVAAHKNAGTYYVKAKVAEDDNYMSATSKAVKLTIRKAANTLTVSPAKKAVKKADLATAQSFAIRARNAKGTVTFTALSTAKKAGIRVTPKGKVTIPKNCKKGVYKIRTRASGDRNYKAKDLDTVIAVK